MIVELLEALLIGSLIAAITLSFISFLLMVGIFIKMGADIWCWFRGRG